jgi:hypothetical protein
MLAEQLMRIEGLEVIQCNTDGITVSCPKDQIENYHKVCNWWQKVTQLELEFNNYSKMCIRDCNNYIAVYENGNVKRKGAYEYQDLGHHQDQSALVIPKAVEASLVSGVSIDQYIKSHTDKYDFMLRVKVPRSNRLISVDEFGIESEEQKICRYYVSNSGVTLLKIMPALEGGKTIKVWYNNKKDESIETDSPSKEVPLQKRIEKGEIVFVKEYFKKNEERTQEIEAGWKVQLCNNIKYYNGDINYEYYIHEANKLVEIFK